jgi:hypothetical protein
LAIAGKDLDFQIVKESWNVYELHDGTILKVRFVLLKVIRTTAFNPDGEPMYAFATKNFLAPRAPKKLMGPPTNPPPTEEQMSSSSMADVDFRAREESWNEYIVEDGTRIRVKLIVTKVERSNFFDQMGYPFYRVASQQVSAVKAPNALKKKTMKLG